METHNTEKTAPFFWLRLGYAMGVCAEKIGVCRDCEDISRLAADAIKLGAGFAGAKICDFGVQSLPITRSGARFHKTGATAYAGFDKGTNSLKITLLDSRGIHVPPEKLLRGGAEILSPDFSGFKITPGPEPEDCGGYKSHYLREIINGIASEKFGINMCLSTKSKTVSDIIEAALKELYLRLDPKARGVYEFRGMISDDGERLALQRADGTYLGREQTLSLIIYVLLRDSDARTFVLPEYVSKQVEEAVLNWGGNVVRAEGDDGEVMAKILKHGSREQMLMQYDGIYAALKILDFLNRFDISFESLCDHLPRIFKAEAEVECGPERARDIMNSIKKKYGGADERRGLRIAAEGGVTLIIPEGSGVIRIISESESFEAAEEISALFKNKIKTLAKGETL